MNYNIEDKSFPDSANIASPRPIYKKKSWHKIENYRPITIFNIFNIQIFKLKDLG